MIETLLYLEDIQMIKNVRILALARNEQKAKERFKQHLNRKSLHFIIQDVNIPIHVEEPIHFIIHAASQASPKYYGSDPTGTLKANVVGTLNLCELAKENPVKSFLYFSSGEVYGIVDENIKSVKETDYGYLDPMNVRSCYGESKRMGETICTSYHHQYNVPTKIVRPAHTYGPGMDLNDGRVFADFVRDIVQNKDIVLNSDGSATRAFCYLSDAVIAFFKILLQGKNGEAYNMANPSCEITIRELAEKLVTLFPEKKLKVIRKDNAPKGYIASANIRNNMNIDKLKLLKWEPQTSIEEGFYRTILSYEQ
jgi:nucleoside-diphosphate-sugar epimerase